MAEAYSRSTWDLRQFPEPEFFAKVNCTDGTELSSIDSDNESHDVPFTDAARDFKSGCEPVFVKFFAK